MRKFIFALFILSIGSTSFAGNSCQSQLQSVEDKMKYEQVQAQLHLEVLKTIVTNNLKPPEGQETVDVNLIDFAVQLATGDLIEVQQLAVTIKSQIEAEFMKASQPYLKTKLTTEQLGQLSETKSINAEINELFAKIERKAKGQRDILGFVANSDTPDPKKKNPIGFVH